MSWNFFVSWKSWKKRNFELFSWKKASLEKLFLDFFKILWKMLKLNIYELRTRSLDDVKRQYEKSLLAFTKKDKLFRLLAYFSKFSAKSVLEKYQIFLENSWKCPGFFILKMSGNPVHSYRDHSQNIVEHKFYVNVLAV